MTASFDESWEKAGLDDEALSRLQNEILQCPDVGYIMHGTGGLRKMRFALPGRGKNRSVRVTYVDFREFGVIYLIFAWTKKEKENLSRAEIHEVKRLIASISESLEGR